jgi:hypothetical protein
VTVSDVYAQEPSPPQGEAPVEWLPLTSLPVTDVPGACTVAQRRIGVFSFFGIDPILTGVLSTPIFYALGVAVYRIYYGSFERTGEQSLRGLVFFFGILFIVEVLLLLIYDIDYRLVEAPYIGRS